MSLVSRIRQAYVPTEKSFGVATASMGFLPTLGGAYYRPREREMELAFIFRDDPGRSSDLSSAITSLFFSLAHLEAPSPRATCASGSSRRDERIYGAPQGSYC